jgi:hypothetical protein
MNVPHDIERHPALDYLDEYNKGNFKFSKVRQVYLLEHFYNQQPNEMGHNQLVNSTIINLRVKHGIMSATFYQQQIQRQQIKIQIVLTMSMMSNHSLYLLMLILITKMNTKQQQQQRY